MLTKKLKSFLLEQFSPLRQYLAYVNVKLAAQNEKLTELTLRLQALEARLLYQHVPPPRSSVEPQSPSTPELNFHNLFDELPYGDPNGFKIEELLLDTGYKENT